MSTGTTKSENRPAAGRSQSLPSSSSGDMRPVNDLTEYFITYARQRPDVTALWCFGIGFVLGWKLKPW